MTIRAEILDLCDAYEEVCSRKPTVLVLDEQTLRQLGEEMNTRLVVNTPNSFRIEDFKLEILVNTLALKRDCRVLG
jgi:hypothetical protein